MKLFMRIFQSVRLTSRLRGQTGGLLIETVVALTVFGVLGSAVLSGVQTSFLSKGKFDVQSEAENLVRNQMENALKQPYKAWPTSGNIYYDPVTSTPAGYTITAEAVKYSTSTDTNIETIRVTVTHQGETVKVFETIRTNR
jgi:type II secretory pathway pseudopilin PulG